MLYNCKMNLLHGSMCVLLASSYLDQTEAFVAKGSSSHVANMNFHQLSNSGSNFGRLSKRELAELESDMMEISNLGIKDLTNPLSKVLAKTGVSLGTVAVALTAKGVLTPLAKLLGGSYSGVSKLVNPLTRALTTAIIRKGKVKTFNNLGDKKAEAPAAVEESAEAEE
ncbi:hypothetical protein K493DRAFT_388817 [Basidiobolus meristosporus CBS 931.73]|uniref:DUF1279 domain-containing protein n=1 Tax=Basidiobolus meristosporus CBS 931.73 TaxID=1314790 RepID=A0A1Y1YU24_9FUNG|nr:hypothetical protein K493DRAFT_388817 [Basidiobolus meristosporus CBS 931.73]|eukprot:ORY01538.1 hypothetical protein K493DRAFT_388817 [Basidiobolus meristosporus CBS 931.73]